MDTVFRDMRYAARVLLRTPGFTVVAVMTLVLGIGANTIIFTFLSAVVLRPLPYPNAERLVQVWETSESQQASQENVSPHNFADWRDQTASFEQIGAYRYLAFNVTTDDQPERIVGAGVSATFFRVLGVQPVIGRDFDVEEDSPGKNRVVIVSYGLWQRRFGSNRGLVGQSLTLNGESHTVIGVMPPDFQFPESVELWVPLGIDLSRVERGNHFLSVIGRLRSNATLQTAQSEIDAIARRLGDQFPNTNTGRGASLISLHEQIVGKVRKGLFVLFGGVALLLVVSCVNVANLLLSRATVRQGEMAIRSALGASRLRLVQQCLIETLLLALAGGGLGLLLASWGTGLLVPLIASSVPRSNEIRVNGWVLAFTLGASLLTGILSGLAPALSAVSRNLNESLKDIGRGITGRRERLRDALIVSEIAVALLLLIGAGLLVNSLLRLQQVNPGFERENTLTMQISLPRSRYGEGRLQVAFFQQVLDRMSAIQGVQYIGAVSDLPFSGSRTASSFEIGERPPANRGESRTADLRIATPNYFSAMGIPLLEGSDFTDRDDKKARGVAIVNQAMARRYWPSENAIGKRLIVGSPEERAFYGAPIWREIIGVVGDVKHDKLDEETTPEIYLPYPQCPSPRMSVAVKTLGSSRDLAVAARSAVQTVDPGQPVYNISTMKERVRRSISTRRMNALLLGAFAAVALLLAAVGIYGVVSYSVTQRTREIGIRMALGAQRRDVLKLIVGHGVLLAVAGVGFGSLTALGLTRLMSNLVFGVSTSDPVTFGGVSALLFFVALVACYIPARRATRIDPMTTLRCE